MESESGSGSGSAFPASIEAAWGLRARPHKGPKRGLSLDGIVAAAVKVADDEGIDAVSMSRVAKELGASTMALYRYVATKDELVELMVDAAMGPPPSLPDDIGWRAGLKHFARSVRTALQAHPWSVLTVAAHGPPATPNQLAWLNLSLRILAGTGLSEPAKIATTLLLTGQVRNELSISVSMMAKPSNDQRWMEYEPFLLRVTEDGRLPFLRQAVEIGAFTTVDQDFETEEEHDDFAFGLERILDGIGVYIEAQKA